MKDKEYRMIEINGCIEVPWEVTEEDVWRRWNHFVEANHWAFGGGIQELYEDEEREIEMPRTLQAQESGALPLLLKTLEESEEEEDLEDDEDSGDEDSKEYRWESYVSESHASEKKDAEAEDSSIVNSLPDSIEKISVKAAAKLDDGIPDHRPNDFAKYEGQVESLLSSEYHVIDFLPMRVDIQESSFYFDAEQFFLKEKELKGIAKSFVRIVLKLLCYFPFEIYTGEYEWQPEARCNEIAKWIRTIVAGRSGEMGILFPKEDTFLLIQGGSLGMTVFHCSERIENVLAPLVWSEGFFWWEGEDI